MFHRILDWSEVWAPLIPLAFIIARKNKPAYLKPVWIFIIIAFFLNIGITLIWRFKLKWGFQEGDFLWSNNFIYNILSVVRIFLFAWFFKLLGQKFMHRIKLVIPFGFLLFVLINFIFYEDFFYQQSFSSRLLSTEAALLLFYCLQYYIFLVIEDRATGLTRQKGFWVVLGLSIYVAVNFFIFLFYEYLTKATTDFAISIWDIHNLVFIILCICIAKQFTVKNE
jgi:hypothetical protein